jgi:hypothetical protein
MHFLLPLPQGNIRRTYKQERAGQPPSTKPFLYLRGNSDDKEAEFTHSFWWRPKKPRANRVDGTEFKEVETKERQMLLDPRHEVNHVQAQMADHNGGFVTDFVQANPKSTPEQRQFVMGLLPAELPARSPRPGTGLPDLRPLVLLAPRPDLAQPLFCSH